MDVVFLLQIGKAKIELNFAQLRVDAESALIYVDRLPIAMGLGIQDTEIGKRADIARIEFQHLIETCLRCRVVARIQSLGRRLKDLLGRIRPQAPHSARGEKQGDQNRRIQEVS